MWLLSWAESDSPPFSMRWHTTFWNCNPDEPMNESPCVIFQNIVCHFSADEGELSRRSEWSDNTSWIVTPDEARNESPTGQFEHKVSFLCCGERCSVVSMKWQSTFWNWMTDEARNASHRVQFKNILYHIWAEKRGMHCRYALSYILCLENVRQLRIWRWALQCNFK